MKINVKFYAILVDLVGKENVSLNLENHSCIRVSELISILSSLYPRASEYISRSLFVYGDRALSRDECIRNSVEIVVLPPGSGG